MMFLWLASLLALSPISDHQFNDELASCSGCHFFPAIVPYLEETLSSLGCFGQVLGSSNM